MQLMCHFNVHISHVKNCFYMVPCTDQIIRMQSAELQGLIHQGELHHKQYCEVIGNQTPDQGIFLIKVKIIKTL